MNVHTFCLVPAGETSSCYYTLATIRLLSSALRNSIFFLTFVSSKFQNPVCVCHHGDDAKALCTTGRSTLHLKRCSETWLKPTGSKKSPRRTLLKGTQLSGWVIACALLPYPSIVRSSKGAGLSQTGQVHVGFFSFICRKKTASKHCRWAQVKTRQGTPSRIFTSCKKKKKKGQERRVVIRDTLDVQDTDERCHGTKVYSLDR